jgi:hypothetical protein
MRLRKVNWRAPDSVINKANGGPARRSGYAGLGLALKMFCAGETEKFDKDLL